MIMHEKTAKNILMTCAIDDGVGGVQVVFRDLVRSVERNGREVHLLYPAPPRSFRPVEHTNAWGRQAFFCPMPSSVSDNVLLRLAAFVAFMPITCFHLARFLRRKKIDVINCHYLSLYFIHLVLMARLLHIRLVVSVHGADVDQYAASGWTEKLFFRLIMRGAHRVVACSNALARETVAAFPAVRSKTTYAHNALDGAHYTATHPRSSLPRPFLLSVCRHVHKKGVDTLLRAFAVVLRTVPHFSLVLVGDGPLLQDHRELARTLRIEHRVLFTGSVPHAEVAPFFDGCTLYVQPSRAEPFGLVLLEAAYFGKAVVCTAVGGVPEIIENGVNGLLVPPDDPAAMAERILDLLRNPDVAARLGAQGHETLKTRFCWQERVHDYIAIYEGRPGPSTQSVSRYG